MLVDVTLDRAYCGIIVTLDRAYCGIINTTHGGHHTLRILLFITEYLNVQTKATVFSLTKETVFHYLTEETVCSLG